MTLNDMVESFVIRNKTRSAIQIIDIRHTKFMLHRSIQMLQFAEKEKSLESGIGVWVRDQYVSKSLESGIGIEVRVWNQESVFELKY